MVYIIGTGQSNNGCQHAGETQNLVAAPFKDLDISVGQYDSGGLEAP